MENRFDLYDLPEGHEARFEARLAARRVQRRRRRVVLQCLAAAAAVGLIVWLCLPGGQSRFRHANSPEAVYEAYLEQIGELYRLLATNSDDQSVDWESVIQEMTDEAIPLYEQLPDELSDKEKTAILKDYYGGILDDATQLQEEMKRKHNPSL